jgi:hypothetical protein
MNNSSVSTLWGIIHWSGITEQRSDLGPKDHLIDLENEFTNKNTREEFGCMCTI